MDHSEVETFIENLNAAWLTGDYDSLYDYFARDVVMELSGSEEPITGVADLVESYREFGESGALEHFEVTRLKTIEHEAFSICHMDFEVAYQLDDNRYRERGRDIYVIASEDGDSPSIVWRTQHIFS